MTQHSNEVLRVLANVIGMIIGGIILALWVADCKERRETHDTVIELKQKLR
jgi:uncharacterized membrane-anchored protein YhcB (DUF1043 family)